MFSFHDPFLSDITVGDVLQLSLARYLDVEARYALFARGGGTGGGGSSGRQPRRRIARYSEAGREARETARAKERRSTALVRAQVREIRKLDRRIARGPRAAAAAAARDRRALTRFFRDLRPGQRLTTIPSHIWRRRLARLEGRLSPRTESRVAKAVGKAEREAGRGIKAIIEKRGIETVYPLRTADRSKISHYWSAFRKLIRTRDFEAFQIAWRRSAAIRTIEGPLRLETDPKRLRELVDQGNAKDIEDPMQYAIAEAA